MKVEDRPINRGQLRWRASRHALLELDLVFNRFLEQHFDSLSDEELFAFDEFLRVEDADLWEWISGRRECSEARWKGLVDLLRSV